jgi:predicted phosphohydrolase
MVQIVKPVKIENAFGSDKRVYVFHPGWMSADELIAWEWKNFLDTY